MSSWLNSVRNALSFVAKKPTSDENLWHKCKGCGQMVFTRELEENLYVCPACDHHERIGPRLRFEYLFDQGSCRDIAPPKVAEDPLKFRDTKRYTERLKAARADNGEQDALVNAVGMIAGHKAVVGVQDFDFMGGSLGMAAGEAFIKGAETALDKRTPFILVVGSGGARMQEGILSLMQMPRTTVAVRRLAEARLPYIVVLTNPTTGGVTASYAMLGDVHLAEPGALIGFAGPRVIEQTIREKLPSGFQRAEYLRDHGMVDRVVHRHALKGVLARLCLMLMKEPAEAKVAADVPSEPVLQPAA